MAVRIGGYAQCTLNPKTDMSNTKKHWRRPSSKNNSNQSSSQKASCVKTLAYWLRHRQDTLDVIHFKLRPELFKKRYGYLPLIVHRALARGDRRYRR